MQTICKSTLLRQEIRKTLEQTIFSVLQTNLDLQPNMYQDNYYSRVTISQGLLSRSIWECGKIRACTRFRANLFRKGKKMKTGEYALPGSNTQPLQKKRMK